MEMEGILLTFVSDLFTSKQQHSTLTVSSAAKRFTYCLPNSRNLYLYRLLQTLISAGHIMEREDKVEGRTWRTVTSGLL